MRVVEFEDGQERQNSAASTWRSKSADMGSLPSVDSFSQADSNDMHSPRLAQQSGNFQLLTAHDNGQIQVWEAASGSLQPVCRIGQTGTSAR